LGQNGVIVIARLGSILYWTANGIAVLLTSLGAIGFVIALINHAGEGTVPSRITDVGWAPFDQASEASPSDPSFLGSMQALRGPAGTMKCEPPF
jgi:hypothetical protein